MTLLDISQELITETNEALNNQDYKKAEQLTKANDLILKVVTTELETKKQDKESLQDVLDNIFHGFNETFSNSDNI